MANQTEPGTTAAEEPGRYGSATRAADAAEGFIVPPGQPPATGPAAQQPGLFADLAVSGGPNQEALPSYHGRPVSWIAVSIIMIGFVMGGFGLVFGPTWWAFWTGAGVAVLGLLVALVTNTFEDWY
jgi:hypothetical protein